MHQQHQILQSSWCRPCPQRTSQAGAHHLSNGWVPQRTHLSLAKHRDLLTNPKTLLWLRTSCNPATNGSRTRGPQPLTPGSSRRRWTSPHRAPTTPTLRSAFSGGPAIVDTAWVRIATSEVQAWKVATRKTKWIKSVMAYSTSQLISNPCLCPGYHHENGHIDILTIRLQEMASRLLQSRVSWSAH